MTPRNLLVSGLWRISKCGEARGATKAGKRSESFPISSGDKMDAAPRTAARSHGPGGARGADSPPRPSQSRRKRGNHLQTPSASTEKPRTVVGNEMIQPELFAPFQSSRAKWGASWWELSASGLTCLARNHNHCCKKERHLATPPIKNFNCLK